MTTANGVPYPETEPRPSVSHGGNIAAIDFGTTSCSLAYCLKGNLERIQKVKLDRVNYRVPTAVLIDDGGSIIRFGNEAEDEWDQICDSPSKKNTHFFFRQIKMNLLRDEKVATTYTIKAANGTECFLIEVIAIILRYIKDELVNVDMKGNTYGVKDASDFNWVITVPAIWKHKSKQLMREAAYLAGIASTKGSVIKKLTAVRRDYWDRVTSSPQKADRDYTTPEQLSLALEPEGAALFCMNDAKLPNVKCCLVADIGGGTVDISAITKGGSGGATKLQNILVPTGNNHGGTTVNAAIWKFLGELVEDANFEKFSKTEEYAADIRDIEKRIEDQKLFFGDAQQDSKVKEVVIRLPSAFKTTYGEKLESNIWKKYSRSGDVKLEGRRLVITFRKMEEFFEPAMKAINSCIINCFRECTASVEAVFLVGGFGGCNYVYRKVKPTVDAKYSALYKSPEHTTAVVAGAVMFRKNPDIFSARVADATYGTGCRVRFNASKYGHSEAYRVYDDDGVARCKGLFSLMAAKGSTLRRDKVIVSDFSPGSHGATSMSFTILATNDKSPYYAYTPGGDLMSGINKVGNVMVPMPDLTGDKSRTVRLTFDFSDTEIQVQAYDVTSGKKASTVVDFLGD